MQKNLFFICAMAVLGFSMSDASAQTSRQLTSRDPFATYSILKESMIKSPSRGASTERTNSRQMVLEHCVRDYGTFVAENSSDFLADLAQVANDVIALENGFKFFPQELWKRALSGYEQQEVADIRKNTTTRARNDVFFSALQERVFPVLVKKLNDYRAQSTLTLPVLALGSQSPCEYTIDPVKIVTTPRAERVQIMNQHIYNLCTEQGRKNGFSALDKQRCDRWLDFGQDGLVEFGVYKVFALWSDQRSIIATMDVATLPKKGEFYEFSINKPNGRP